MSKRLIEVATELNVGVKTIVEFLTDKGFDVGNNPRAKVSDEMYESLLLSFQKSLALKEQAEQIGSRKEKPKEKLKPWERPTLGSKEPKSLQNPPVSTSKNDIREDSVKTPVVEPQEQQPPVVVKNEPQPEEVQPKIDAGKQQPEEEPKTDSPHVLKGPKILGKVDLDANKKNVQNKNRQPEQQKQQQQKQQQPPVVPVQKDQPPVENKPKEQLPQDQPKQEKQQPPVVEVKEQPVAPIDTTPKKVDKNAPPEIDEHRAETPQLQGLKILGKINIEPGTGGKKKKKKKILKEAKPVLSQSRNETGGNKANENRGPRKEGDKKPEGETPKTEGENSGSGNNANRNKDRKRTKPGDNKPATSGAGGNNNNAPSSSGGDKKRKPGAGGKKEKRKEITEKEVQDTYKATMSAMRGGTKRAGKNTTRSERDERKERLRNQGEDEAVPKLQVTEFVSVSELANLMEVSASEVITACMKAGIYVSINQRLDTDVIELIAMEFDFEVEFVSAEDQIEAELEEIVDDPEDLQPRAPIVTVMGHVDHGKTSLLDRIRKANVVAGEAGGITQHIGAYEVKVGDKGKITFLDTPGHEAFTAMRARGAKVTDIAVIIVAADDNVMPQTKEAISHAQAAGVPIIFAINKIDKDGANPERIKQELGAMGFLVEEWGGKYQSQEISAKKGLNIDALLEKILLEAELLELKANPNRNAVGTVLEASLEKGRGYVTKMLIQTGTLHDGDIILAGQHYGRVKAMFNERGKRIKEAGPSAPVLVLGLDGAPQAGEKIKVMEEEREAKDLAQKRAQLIRQQQIRATRRITLDDINRRLKIGNFQELKLIVKCDMDGSVEALSDALLKLSTNQVQTAIVYKAVGPITESDVNLAAASDAIIIGFQVRPNPMAKKLAEQEGVEIKTYSIIYDAIEEVKSALEGMLEPKQVEEEVGLVEIQQVFNITKVGNVAGCLVKEGRIHRNSFVRVIRNGIVVFPKKEGVHGKLASLKRFKDNIMEVKAGMECGLSLDNFEDIRPGDMLEVYEIKEVKQTLESVKKDQESQQ